MGAKDKHIHDEDQCCECGDARHCCCDCPRFSDNPDEDVDIVKGRTWREVYPQD